MITNNTLEHTKIFKVISRNIDTKIKSAPRIIFISEWMYLRVSSDSCGPPPIILINKNIDTELRKSYVNIKLYRNPMSEKSDMYEFIMALFDNGYSEEFLLFQWNYKMMLDVSVTMTIDSKNQYLCPLIRGKSLHDFVTTCVHILSITSAHLNHILLCLCNQPPPY